MLSFMELLKMAIIEFVVGGISLSLVLFPFISIMDDFIKAESEDEMLEKQEEQEMFSRSVSSRQGNRGNEMLQFHAELAFWVLLISSFALIGGIAAGYSLFLYLKENYQSRPKNRRRI